GNIGPPVDPSVTTRVVEFNDVPALEQALANGDVACVLAEPALTNVGIVHPIPGYHHALRELTRKYGTLLIIDETHTICAGPGGYTRAENLDPDFLVFGKPIAGGLPGAAYGFTQKVADMILERHSLEDCDTGGIGGTLAGNALSLAAMRATLTKGHQGFRSPLACHAPRMPRRIFVQPQRAEDRDRGPQRYGLRTRTLHASL